MAISSAAGLGVRAIVRLSGREAVALADRVLVWSQRPVGEAPGFQSMPVIVRLGAEASELPARVYVFRAPRSYTREDVVELHVPGAASVASALEASLAEAGARRAEPGEFTARALLSGRIDLSAAEAVADVVNAADEAQLRSAVSALGGTVHRFCGRASQELTEILACVEASIDLADEDVTLDHPNPLAALLDGWSARLRRIADEAADLPDAAEQPRAVLAGRTNVGKSSLLNALTGTPRAIVSALAGTTRDVLSASMTVGGAGLTVQDAAGFAGPAGPLAATAHSAARSAVAAADLILLVVDVTAGAFGPDAAVLQEVRRSNPSAPVLLLANKADLIGASPPPMGVVALSREANARVLLTSAVTARGLEQVKQALAACLHLEASRSGQALGLHRRQKRCLLSAGEGTARAAELLQSAGEIVDVAELAAVELRSALRELGRISGEVVTEDVLAAIFARFCVGK